VPDSAKQTASDSVTRGWAELADRSWDAATATFEEALAAAPTADAFEGLSWSAWWLDDAEAVYGAREQASDAVIVTPDRGELQGGKEIVAWVKELFDAIPDARYELLSTRMSQATRRSTRAT
jgi:hypothetical protein